MIRPATEQDLPRILVLGYDLHQASGYRDIAYDAGKVEQLLRGLMDGKGVCFVAEKNGLVIGGIAGGVDEYWFSHELVGFDYTLLIDPEHVSGITALKLIAALKNWCKSKGATKLKMGITTGIHVEQTSKLYEVAGFKPDGNLFVMEL